jgi:hypothetical protein
MADKYTKGNRNYHVVEEGKMLAKCGFDFTDIGPRETHLEATKTKAGWPTCPLCLVFDDLPEEMKLKLHHK